LHGLIISLRGEILAELWNVTILYNLQYLRTLECHHIVRPTISTYSGMPPYCTTHDIYVLWNATILYDPRYLRTLECHHIVRSTISTNSIMPPYCTIHDIYELWNATILYDPRYLQTLECHHIVRPTIYTNSGMPPYRMTFMSLAVTQQVLLMELLIILWHTSS
jgi:hypothetical protein